MDGEQTSGRLSRRTALRLAGAGSAMAVGGLTIGRASRALAQEATPEPGEAPTGGAYELAPLPYGFDALEPTIIAETMELHYTKLHANYVKELNALVDGQDAIAGLSPEELIQSLDLVPEDEVANLMGVVKPRRQHVRTNAGGHVNHTLFWNIMSPQGGGEPTGAIAAAIDGAFGDFATMKEAVRLAGLGNVGSGWVWVTLDAAGAIALTTTADQDNPLMEAAGTPILGLDVWEHAYLLQYGSERARYIDSWFNVVDWDAVNTRLEEAGSV